MITITDILKKNEISLYIADIGLSDLCIDSRFAENKQSRLINVQRDIPVLDFNALCSIDEVLCDIAEEEVGQQEEGICQIMFHISNDGNILGTAHTFVSFEDKYPEDISLPIDSVQDALNKHSKALTTLKGYSEPLVLDIHYAGFGDDGSVERIALRKAGEEFIMEDNESIHDWVLELVDNLDYDWKNNDGGMGDIAIEIKEGLISNVDIEAYSFATTLEKDSSFAIKQDVIDFLCCTNTALFLEKSESLQSQWKTLLDRGVFEPLQTDQDQEEESNSMSM